MTVRARAQMVWVLLTIVVPAEMLVERWLA